MIMSSIFRAIPNPMPPAASPDMILDCQVVPESPPLTQVDDLPGTAVALFNEFQFSGAGPSSRAVTAAVQTRPLALRTALGRLCGARQPVSITLLRPVLPLLCRISSPAVGGGASDS